MYKHADATSRQSDAIENGGEGYDDGLLFRRFSQTISNHQWDMTTVSGYREPIITRNIPFQSSPEQDNITLCGHAHIAYIPNGRVLSVSRIAHLIQFALGKVRSQEALTMRIARMLVGAIEPHGQAVVLNSHHIDMDSLDSGMSGARHITRHLSGVYQQDRDMAYKFLSSIQA